MKKRLLLTSLTLASAALLAACGAAPSASPSGSSEAASTAIGDSIKIGYNQELSGTVAAYGIGTTEGAELAVEMINAAGGIDGKQLEVVSKDNKSESAEAATIATSLVTQDQVVAIIGPTTSGATDAAAPNVTAAGVPLITPGGSKDSLTINADGTTKEFIFRATFQDSFQGEVLAQYAGDNLSAKKVFLYFDASSDYAKGIAETFKASYTGEIVAEESYQAGDKDFQAALTKVKDQEFDAIVIPGYYTEAGLITKQAREMGIDQPILGPDGFADAKFIETAGEKNTTGVYYVSGYSTKVELSDKADAFVTAYKEKYGKEPSMFNALGYDAVNMLAEAAKGAKTSKDIAANLAKLTDFDGVTGKMTIDDKHNPIKSAIMVGLDQGQEATAEVIEPK